MLQAKSFTPMNSMTDTIINRDINQAATMAHMFYRALYHLKLHDGIGDGTLSIIDEWRLSGKCR